MKSQLILIFISLIIFSCSENSKEITKKEVSLEIDTAFLYVTDSIDKTKNLTHFQYQNLTVWGGIEAWYEDSIIVKIRATKRGELGFIQTTHFYENTSNFKSIKISHTPNWQEFEEKYEKGDVADDDRMTFINDTIETILNRLDTFELQMIKEAGDLQIFINNENKLFP
jgi:hypothetical protein